MMLERMYQELARDNKISKFHLVRYGNVVGSTGSVVEVWRRMAKDDGKVDATDPDMTRFWLTANHAVQILCSSIEEPSGTILVPKLPALSMADLANHIIDGDVPIRYHGLRPGEKRHECLMTEEEIPFAEDLGNCWRIHPRTSKPLHHLSKTLHGRTSDSPIRFLAPEEFLRMAEEV
jgi:UDP-N-acetylglucosamine 4,6-dehydratase